MTGVSILSNVTTGMRVALEIAWGADLTDLTGATWTWTDVSTDVDAHDQGIAITVGRPDESEVTQPSVMTCLLDNTSGKYSLGPQSSNYPNVRRNTPVRVRVSTDSGSTWKVKYQGNAVGFTPNWDSTGRYATVTLTASGPLRQLNQGTRFALSSMYVGTMADSTVQAYWPLEDDQNSTVAHAPIGGADGTFRAYNYSTNSWSDGNNPGNFASYSNVPGSAPMLAMGSGGGLELSPAAAVIGTTATTSSMIVGNPTGQSGPNGCLISIYTPNGAAVKRWDIFYQCDTSSGGGFPGALSLYGVNSASFGVPYATTPTVSVANITFGLLGNTDYEIGLALSNSGATTTYDIRVYQLGAFGTLSHLSGTVGSNTGGSQVSEIILGPFACGNVPFGHVTIRNTVMTNGADGAWLDAHINEVGTTRLTRLANAANIPVTILTDTNGETSGNVADAMGFQFYDTVTNQLREAEATGLGVLYDGINNGLTYVTRLLRESQQPSMTVDATQGAIVMPFAPIDDDQTTVNDVSLSQRDGSTVTSVDAVSQNAIGDYQNSFTVNQYVPTITQLLHVAQWLLHIGTATTGTYRYPTWTFELEKKPSLIASWLNCFPACRVDVTNISSVRTQHASGTLRNVLEGWAEVIGQHRWTVVANTTTYEPWRVATLAAATGTTVDTLGRYESDGSTVTTSVSAGATSLSVTTASGPKWTTSSVTADDFPLTVAINGYPITVTAISSTTSPQTFTVSAVPVAISAGSKVTVYQNAVLGM